MKEQDYILFEDYLTGQLSEAEIEQLQERLTTDNALKMAFETYKEASDFLQNTYQNQAETDKFQKELTAISDRYFADTQALTTKKPSALRPWMGIAAGILLVFGIFMTQLFSDPQYSDYANYPEISLTVRGAENEVLLKAEQAFNSKDYKTAHQLFTQLLDGDAGSQELKLYQALSLIELQNYTQADSILAELIGSSSVYQSEAQWYAALSKLKQDDKASCVALLQRITEDSEHYKQAQKLLKKL